MILFGVTCFSSPIWGWFARRWLLRFEHYRRARFLCVQLYLICIALLIVETPWSFRGLLVDAVFLSLGYFSFMGIAFSASALKPKFLTWIVPVAAMVPTIAGMFVTVTLLGLMFIIGDYVPEKAGTIDFRHTYRITYYGNATTSNGGARVQVLYHPLLLPFLERPIFDRELEFTDYDFTEAEVKGVAGAILVTCPTTSHSQKVFSVPIS